MQPAIYTITVRNPTKVTALGVIVCDRLPAGMVFVSAHIATHLHDGSRCWSIASLAAGRAKPFSVTARSLSGAQGTLVNVASLSGPSIDPRQARAPVRVLARRVPAGGVTG